MRRRHAFDSSKCASRRVAQQASKTFMGSAHFSVQQWENPSQRVISSQNQCRVGNVNNVETVTDRANLYTGTKRKQIWGYRLVALLLLCAL